MASSNPPPDLPDDDEALLDADEAAEEIADDGDVRMDSDDDGDDDDGVRHTGGEEEISLQNDSLAHFDAHTDSIFCIAQHPTIPSLVATGGGDDTAYIFSADAVAAPVLPASYQSAPSARAERASLPALAKLSGVHTDSINAIAFTLPHGEFLCTGGLDGKLAVHSVPSPKALASPSLPTQRPLKVPLLAQAAEVPEINFLAPCPHPSYPNTVALGASDGSVWIYTIAHAASSTSPADAADALQIQRAYYLHTEPCTAGAWTPDGQLLATVAEDGSLYVWDPWGAAAAAGVSGAQGGQAVVGLTAADQRFAVDGGLFSVAISHAGTLCAVGGADGTVRVVGLPVLPPPPSSTSAAEASSAPASKKAAASKKKKTATQSTTSSSSQTGQILASLHLQTSSVESLAFSLAGSLLASASTDGSIAVFDAAHRFELKRHLPDAHEAFAVVRVAWVGESRGGKEYELTSCGMDGVVRRWDLRGSARAGERGLLREWRGHRGEGEGGGVLGFVGWEGREGGRVVTAGDDGVGLVFGG